MDNENALKKQKNKTIDMIDKDQTPSGSPDIGELEQAVKDVPADENWTEKTQGKVAPIENAGTTEIEHSKDMRKRFAMTHDFESETTVTGEKSSGKHNFGKTDKPADETPAHE